MSLFSFFKKNKESYSLVFTIGSGNISGGIIRFTEKSGVDITYYNKEVIPFQQNISISKHFELMKSSLASLTQDIRSVGLKKIKTQIDKIFYVFSSPWSMSQTQTVKIRESRPFKVTKNYLDKIVDEQEKIFQNNIAKSGKVVEKKIVQIKVNGYILDNIYDKTVSELEVTIFFTVVPDDILEAVDSAVSKTFSVKNIWCHSTLLSVFSIIRNLYPKKDDFICIDISEEITDISIVKDNIMISSASTPVGRNYFIRELSQRLNVSEEIADSKIKMHCLKNNDELGNLKFAVMMDDISKSWVLSVSEILNTLRGKIYVPDSVFLIADNDLSSFLKNKLEEKDLDVLLVDYKNIKTQKIKDNLVYRLVLMFLDNLYKI